jgi:hypothetical protein
MSYFSRNFEETFLDMVLQRCESITYPAKLAIHCDVSHTVHSAVSARVWIPVYNIHTALYNVVTNLLDATVAKSISSD